MLYAQMEEEISSQCSTRWQFRKKLPFKSTDEVSEPVAIDLLIAKRDK